jgi:4'-phosphopantetheinyl transferase
MDRASASPSKGILPAVGQDWIDVWPIRLVAPDSAVERFAGVLSPEESARASRFRFDHLKRSYLLSTGALRVLIGRYLGINPLLIRFKLGEKGKPRVSGQRLCFNASHSGSLALFAFTMGCELGVDVEEIRPLVDMNEIAQRFFCAEEAAELLSIPDGERCHAFFLCWTRKEAYLKAIGEGLSAPLDRFRVTLRPEETCRFLHLWNDPLAAEEWNLYNLEPAPGYAAALAYRGFRRRVRMFPVLVPETLLDGARNPLLPTL